MHECPVRTLNKAPALREALAADEGPAADLGRLEVVAADLLADAGWAEAMVGMTRPEEKGCRFPTDDRFLWMKDVADILRHGLPPEMTGKVPSREATAWLLR